MSVITLNKHLISIDEKNFVNCDQTTSELMARTALVAHLDKNALIFLPWQVEGQKETTIFYPAYRNEGYVQRGDLKTLIRDMNLQADEGVLFGSSGAYAQQPCLGVFPRGLEVTLQMLNRWLHTQRRFLQTRSFVNDQLTTFIDVEMAKMVEHDQKAS